MSEETREQRLIDSIKQLTRSEFIGDDCAILGESQLLSTDMLVEDKHFRLSYADLESVGWKCVAVNLSDIAAMGGFPTALLVSIAWPEHRSDAQFKQFYRGIQDCARKFSSKIVGGDLTSSDKIVCSITILGHTARRARPFLRSSAKAGQLVVVSGDFGASACGFESLKKGLRLPGYSTTRHLRPQPRIASGLTLSQIMTHRSSSESLALMDCSDGLADAALQVSKASGVRIEIDLERIPVHAETRLLASELGLDPIELALYGGEDFELFACMSNDVWTELNNCETETPFSVIGRVTNGAGAHGTSLGTTVQLANSRTYQHFAS